MRLAIGPFHETDKSVNCFLPEAVFDNDIVQKSYGITFHNGKGGAKEKSKILS
jgi:hypothetical protein